MCLVRFLIVSLNRLPFRDRPIRESILTQAPESPVPLQLYSTTFQSVTRPGTSGTGVLKNFSSLFEPCVV